MEIDNALHKVWKEADVKKWRVVLGEVGKVSEEDINGFLRLVGERDKRWHSWKLGWFVSLVLEYCYPERVIELDVNLVEGKIDVGRDLNWDGVVYVNGDVSGDVGYNVRKGTILVNGTVNGNVGFKMRGGFVGIFGVVNGWVGSEARKGTIYIEGNVRGIVGELLNGGSIVVNGNITGNVGISMNDGKIIVNGDIGDYIGENSSGGIIVVSGNLRKHNLVEKMGKATIIVNDMIYKKINLKKIRTNWIGICNEKLTDLLRIWRYPKDEWDEKLKELGRVITQDDMSLFLISFAYYIKEWDAFDLGYFVSLVLKYCYTDRIVCIHSDYVNGKIAVGTRLNANVIVYVDGDIPYCVGKAMRKGTLIIDGDVVAAATDMVGGCIIINGDVPYGVGDFMKGGTVIVNGNIKYGCGLEMKGGCIIINGDLEWGIGNSMHDGIIIVNGNVGGRVGSGMFGGIIIVDGDVSSSVGDKSNRGYIKVNGQIKCRYWIDVLGFGLVENNGFIYRKIK